MHWQRVTRAARRAAAGSRSAASGCPPGSQGQAGNGPGRGRGPPAGISVGPVPVTGPGSESPGRSARRGRRVTVTRTVARLAARARGPARRRDSFDIADSELEGSTVGQAGCQCPAPSRARRLRVLSRPERSGSRRRRAAERRGPAAQRTGSIDAPVAARGRAPSADWPGNSDCASSRTSVTVEGPKPASHACTSSAISTVAPAARLLQPPLRRCLGHPPSPPALGGAATGAQLEARWREQLMRRMG
jgi:hypothetical protein